MLILLDAFNTLKMRTIFPGLEKKHGKRIWINIAGLSTDKFRCLVSRHGSTCYWDDIALSLAFHLKAGLNLPHAVKAVSQEGNSYSHKLLDRAYRSYEAGSSMLYALRSVAGNQQEFGVVVDALEMGAVSGGDLPSLLCHISDSIRNRRVFKSEARSKLIEAKISAVILSLIPWIIVIFSWQYDAAAMKYLLEAGPGRFLLAVSFICWLVGNAMIILMIQYVTPYSLKGGT
jgi:Flp pilus assembly protein TadB